MNQHRRENHAYIFHTEILNDYDDLMLEVGEGLLSSSDSCSLEYCICSE